MVRLLITYDTPVDVDAFVNHYDKAHAPLTRRLPGVVDAPTRSCLYEVPSADGNL